MSDSDALYAFRTEDGTWFGPHEQLAKGEFSHGWLDFKPPNAPGSRLAGQELLVRFGPCDGDAFLPRAEGQLGRDRSADPGPGHL